MVLTALLLSLCGDVSGAGEQVRLLNDAPVREQVSVAQLESDLAAVMHMRQSIGLPIAMLIAGSVTAAFGGFFLGMSLLTPVGFVFDNPFVIAGIVMLAIGLPFLSTGVWMLSDRLDARKRITQVSEELRRELYERRRWSGNSDNAPRRMPVMTIGTF
jgi:predicted small secreted protein